MKLTNYFCLFSFVAFVAACSNSNAPQPTDQPVAATDAPIVGNDVDEHGCKGSAGYTWSVVKNECIAVFSAGIRLNPVDSFMDKTLSAFVVFKSDTEDAQAELYIPKQKGSLVFNKTTDGTGTWKHEDMTLTAANGMYTLEDKDKKVLYQGKNEYPRQ